MKESTDKIITWLGLGIALVCTVLSIVFAMNNGDVKELEAVQNGGLFDATFWILVALVAVSICAIVVFLLIKLANSFSTKKGYAAKFCIILGVIVVVCLAAYLLSNGNDMTPALMDKFSVSTATSKLIGAACYMVYILVGAAAVAIIYTEVAKSLKK
ncbi:MAG: hypothetical protein IJU19_05065 [Bacteroidales bacterium]|nr:hypothetical protein [Bacteroidales bacterium]